MEYSMIRHILFFVGSFFITTSALGFTEPKADILLSIMNAVKKPVAGDGIKIPALNYFYDTIAAHEAMTTASMPHIFKNFSSLLKKNVTSSREKAIVRHIAILAHWLETSEGKVYVEHNERIVYIFLLKIVSVLSRYAICVTIDTIDMLHDAIVYWKDQQVHPWKYFLHKAPQKWFFGKKQYEEIAVNIRDLETMQEYHEKMLGKMVRYMYTFEQNYSNEQYYAWMTDLCTVLDELYVVPVALWEKVQKKSPTIDTLLKKFSYHFDALAQHKHTVEETLVYAKKPHHFVRNWLIYSAIAGVAAYCYFDPSGWIHIAWTSLMGFDIKKNFEEYVKRPLLDLKETTIGNKMPEKLNVDDMPRFEAEIKQKELDKAALVSKMVQNAKNAGVSEDVLKKIEEGLQNGDTSSYEKFLELVNKLTWKGDLNSVAIDGYKDFFLRKIEIESLELYRKCDGIMEYAQKVVHYANERIYEKDRESNLPLKVAAIMPAAGFIYGICKLYGWMRSKNYAPLNAMLCDIENDLIIAGTELSDDVYGKLLYKIHVFKKKIRAMLGIRHVHYRDLVNHIELLSDNTKTVQQKKELIRVMRVQYPFFAAKS